MITKQLLINEILELPENLKEEVLYYIDQLKARYNKQSAPIQKTLSQPFKVRQFHLGTETNLNRADLYDDKNQYVCN